MITLERGYITCDRILLNGKRKFWILCFFSVEVYARIAIQEIEIVYFSLPLLQNKRALDFTSGHGQFKEIFTEQFYSRFFLKAQ